eukprot:TRINITY_DN1555_c0_g1_i4.p2 TRINITY_DN1555_c0_g1~~TRINITY_DN1555_c0_g1_i4.p2  ORF type:complete len:128 (+),score=23.80 TRINITY_DN1555_c0_g1_i4:164-547(+)
MITNVSHEGLEREKASEGEEGCCHSSDESQAAAGNWHGCAALYITLRSGVVCTPAALLPHRKGLWCMVGETESDQLQGVAGHHALKWLPVTVLKMTRADDKARVSVALVDQVHGRGILVPAGDITIL